MQAETDHNRGGCESNLEGTGKLGKVAMGKFTDIVKSETPTLVDFYATWCGPCKMMHPILDQLKDQMGSKVRILKIDVDKNQDVAEKFKVRGVPTFVLFKNGEILWRQSGVIELGTLKSKINQSI